MAEQLNKNDYIKHPDKIGAYNYYSLGETTIKQLQENNLISSKTKKFQAKKPDALITDDNKNVIVYIENKDIGELETDEQIKSAFNQEIEVARAINAKIYIITDTVKSFWYNPLTKNEIIDENNECLRVLFKHNENKKELEKLIKKIILSISKDSDAICKTEYLDPTDLAKKIQQKIWIRNGASPQTCLYTFVELFIFKYLSDLGVLTGINSFNSLYEMYEDEGNTNEYILDYYLGKQGPRERIKALFPKGIDETTIVNGDVFHADKNANGEYINNGDGETFKSIIYEFKKYETEHGKFLNVNKDFKSKLFESFLKNEKDKKKMGQFFTPLKVVQSMNRMIDIKNGDSICDPACGVGKFLLEAISENLENYYRFSDEKIENNIEIIGFDKYSEDNSDRTIILAKANMLIYLSKLITENPSPKLTKEVAKIFNKSFVLKRSNLGTLDTLEENKYDYILTNPPYVVNGSADIKSAAIATGNYNWNGLGVEALFIEWIVKSLKEGGTALVVIPDGILSNGANTNLRNQILNECEIQSIISLPINTFYGTPKKTFILNVKKKYKDEYGKTKKQVNPVFTYICNSIGETLDTYRFDVEDNDLESAVNQYNIYKSSNDKSKFKAILYDENEQPYIDKKCKCIDINDFYLKASTSWIIDNYWTDEEKIELGFKSKPNIMTIEELNDYIDEIVSDLNQYKDDLKCLK